MTDIEHCPPRDCKHGQLARSCDICELESDLAAMTRRAEQAESLNRRALKFLEDVNMGVHNDARKSPGLMDRLVIARAERDVLTKESREVLADNVRLREACKKALTCQASMNSDVVDLIRRALKSGAVAIAATECPACAKLPRTADNVPVTLGMNLYAPNVDFDFGCLQMNADEDTSILCRDERGVEFSMYTFDCYSTREALEAARSTAEKNEPEKHPGVRELARVHGIRNTQPGTSPAMFDHVTGKRMGGSSGKDEKQ